jgi:hypothetical protein
MDERDRRMAELLERELITVLAVLCDTELHRQIESTCRAYRDLFRAVKREGKL